MKTSDSYIFECENFKKIKPIYTYDGSLSHSEWQRRAHEKLTDLLGLPLERSAPNYQMDSIRELGFFTDYKITVETEPGYFVPCHLLVPRLPERPIPLTVCMLEHCGGMHIAIGTSKTEDDERALSEWKERAVGLRAVKEGRCAIVIEPRNMGESSADGYGSSCTEAAKIALLAGRTVIGERIHDAMCILDTLETHFSYFVDMDDINVTGNSTGGLAAFYLACIDVRIKAALCSCTVCEYTYSAFSSEQCLCNYIPGIRKYFEMGDLAGLIAPRKLILAAGIKDETLPFSGFMESYDKIKEIYAALSCDGNCSLTLVDKGNLNYAVSMWRAYNKMK